MSHARLARQLSAYLDGELRPEEMREVGAHLSGCAECQAELARLRALKHLLARVPEVEPPPELWVGLRARLAGAGGPAIVAGMLEAVRAAFRRPAVAAAAVLLVVLLIALPLVKGRIDRLAAAGIGVDLYVREHALLSAADPFADRAYLGLLIGDSNLALAGARRAPGEEP